MIVWKYKPNTPLVVYFKYINLVKLSHLRKILLVK